MFTYNLCLSNTLVSVFLTDIISHLFILGLHEIFQKTLHNVQ